MAAGEIVARLAAERPAFHESGGVARDWGVLPGTLELIAAHAAPGTRTMETGCGASTVTFAACGSEHTAISPHGGEHERVAAWCERHDVPTENLSFAAESSLHGDTLRLARDLQVVFLDGKHAFPAPIVDFHLASEALTVGGVLILDDLPIPAVGLLHDFMSSDPGWEVLGFADRRSGAYRKTREVEQADLWRRQHFNRAWPDYSFLPTRQRLGARAAWALSRARTAAGRVRR